MNMKMAAPCHWAAGTMGMGGEKGIGGGGGVMEE